MTLSSVLLRTAAIKQSYIHIYLILAYCCFDDALIIPRYVLDIGQNLLDSNPYVSVAIYL